MKKFLSISQIPIYKNRKLDLPRFYKNLIRLSILNIYILFSFSTIYAQSKDNVIDEGFEENTCPPQNWVANAGSDGTVLWKCSNGTDLGSGGGFKPPQMKEGGKYLTFVPTSGIKSTQIELITPELNLNGNTHSLSFSYFIHANSTSTTLSVQVSKDGSEYTELATTPDLTVRGRWEDKRYNLSGDIKYIRFLGAFQGTGAPGGAFIDIVKITEITEQTSINETFETGEIPLNWGMETAGTNGVWKIYDTTANGPKVCPDNSRYALAYSGMESIDIAKLTTPLLNIHSADKPVFSFYYWNADKGDENVYTKLTVSYSLNEAAGIFTDIRPNESEFYTLKAATSGKWNIYAVTLPKETKYVRIKVENNGSKQGINRSTTYIDLIKVGESQCYPPIRVKTDPRSYSSALTWEAFDDESAYKLACGLSKTFDLQSQETIWTDIERKVGKEQFYTIEELVPDSTYTVAIKTVCGNNESIDIKTFNFKTLAKCPAPKNLKASDITAKGVSLNWDEVGTASSWIVGYHQTNYASSFRWDLAKTLSANTNTDFALSMNPSDAKYVFVVRSLCGADTSAIPIATSSERVVVSLPPSCPAPKNITITETNTKNFSIKWNPQAKETQWRLRLTPVGSQAVIYNAADSAYTFTNVKSGSVYTIEILASCSAEDSSKWTMPLEVTTLCEDKISDANYPYIEGFESAKDTKLSPCLSESATNVFGSSKITKGINAYEGSRFLLAQHRYRPNPSSAPTLWEATDALLYLPSMEMKVGNTYELSFWYIVGKDGRPTAEDMYSFSIKIANSENTKMELIEGSEVIKIVNTTWQKHKVVFRPQTDGVYQYGIHVTSDTMNPKAYTILAFDEIKVLRISKCPTPDTITLDEVSSTSATLSLDETKTYQVRYGKTFSYNTDHSLKILSGQSEYILDDLDAETQYTFQLRTICSTADTSSWSLENTFTTALACPPPSNLKASNISETGIQLTFRPFQGQTKWEVSIKQGVDFDTTNTSDFLTLNVSDTNFTNLDPGKYYSIALRAVCPSQNSTFINIQFGTACKQASLPYSQDFENMLTGEFPLCMTTLNNSGNMEPKNKEGSYGGTTSHSGIGFIHFLNGRDFIFTPKLFLEEGKEYDFSVWYEGKDTNDRIRLVYGNSTIAAELTTIAEAKVSDILAYKQLKKRFTAAATDSFYLGIFVQSASVAAIDDILIEPYCGIPSDLKVNLLMENSAQLNWKTSADSTQVRYRKIGTNEYILLNTNKKEVKLINLEANTSYEWEVKSLCFYGEGEKIQGENFKTKGSACEAPRGLTRVGVTHKSVNLAWGGIGDQFEIRIKKYSDTTYRNQIVESTAYTFDDLNPSTSYQWGVRTICSETYKSEWVNGVQFATTACPCQEPLGLDTEIKENTAKLIWVSDTGNYIIRYKRAMDTIYTEKTTTSNNIKLTDLQHETEYLWSVRTICAAGDSSKWADHKFMTEAQIAIEKSENTDINISIRNGNFVLHNPSGILIREVQVLSIAGQKVCGHIVNKNSDYEWVCRLPSGTYIVRTISASQVYTVKLFVK